MPAQPDMSGRFYELAVAKDTATLIDLDAALALSRTSIRTLMALSPQASTMVRCMAQEEIDRLHMDCTDEAEGTIALIRNALTL